MSVPSLLSIFGNSGGEDPVYVDDVFSTFVYDGNSSTQAINNGIDLSGEGGLVWVKPRNVAHSHSFIDTERGTTKTISSNSADGQYTNNQLSSFNSNGFTLNSGGNVNGTYRYASWTFRKAPGFFDVVTWTGNDTARTIAHNLGTVPGMIMVKKLTTQDWAVYHRSLGNTQVLNLNNAFNSVSYSDGWDNTTPTSSNFTVGAGALVNASGGEYVAYVFAHDAAQFGTDGNESIIKCGSYSGDNDSQEINLGFEPQFVILKKTSGGLYSGDWIVADVVRGWFGYTPSPSLIDVQQLNANDTSMDGQNGGRVGVTPIGFKFQGEANDDYNKSGQNYIYMAIRRPHKPPESGTEVFAVDTKGGTSPNPPTFNAGFPVDWSIYRPVNEDNSYFLVSNRTRGWVQSTYLNTASANPESTFNTAMLTYDRSDGMGSDTSSDSLDLNWMFKRAPGFFDIVLYSGSGSASAYTHDLGVKPDLKILKSRTTSQAWKIGFNDPSLRSMDLPYDDPVSSSGYFDAEDTATTFYAKGGHSESGASGVYYIAYLFATVPGISKIGSYTGTGNAVNVDCGFTNGARFVLIKRINGTGDWYVWDSVRGIVSGNDPYIRLNKSNAQVTNTDYVDPLSTGFTVTSSAPAVLNTSGGTYLFFAIA